MYVFTTVQMILYLLLCVLLASRKVAVQVSSTSVEDASDQDKCFSSDRYIMDIHVTIQGRRLYA